MGRNEIEPREGGRVRWSIGRVHGGVHGHDLGPAQPIRQHRRHDARRRVPQFDYRIDQREGGGDHDPLRAHRRAERRLGGRVRGDERGRPDVPRQARRVRHLLLRPVRRAGRRLGPERARPRPRCMAMFRQRARPRATTSKVGERCGSRRTGSRRSTASSTTSRRASSACGPTTRSTGSSTRSQGPTMVGHHLFAEGVDQEEAESGLAVLARRACSAAAARRRARLTLLPATPRRCDGARSDRPPTSGTRQGARPRRPAAEAARATRLGAAVPARRAPRRRDRRRADPDVRHGGRHPRVHDPHEGVGPVRAVRARSWTSS